jgi:hypothetical protein
VEELASLPPLMSGDFSLAKSNDGSSASEFMVVRI